MACFWLKSILWVEYAGIACECCCASLVPRCDLKGNARSLAPPSQNQQHKSKRCESDTRASSFKQISCTVPVHLAHKSQSTLSWQLRFRKHEHGLRKKLVSALVWRKQPEKKDKEPQDVFTHLKICFPHISVTKYKDVALLFNAYWIAHNICNFK